MIVDKYRVLRHIEDIEDFIEEIPEAKHYKKELDDLFNIIDEHGV